MLHPAWIKHISLEEFYLESLLILKLTEPKGKNKL